MRLASLFGSDIAVPAGAGDIRITGLTADSRHVAPGMLFAALEGRMGDGAQYAADAVRRGAAVVLAGTTSALPALTGAVVLRSSDPRRSLALAAARFHPRQPETIVAVTGTSGKTSVAEFTRQILQALGRRSASIGTIGVVKPDGGVYGALTTPDPVALHASLDALAREGVTHLAMEASSHGLDQSRLDGVRLAAAAYTNLGRDHFDYHGAEENYLNAKLRLFRCLLEPGRTAVVCADGRHASAVVEVCRARGHRVLTTGEQGRDIRLVANAREGFAQQLTIAAGGREHHVRLPLIGGYQASNALVAAGLAVGAGEPLEAAITAMAAIEGVTGRLEIVGEVRGGLAVVDYAHKPEALAAALAALRPFASGRLICIFGCGGDRDRGKRPLMGRIAVDSADVVIVTDDNPRTENAATIRAEIMAAAPGAIEIGDRAEAIRTGVGLMTVGDVLVVAGKGHEEGQIIGTVTIPFSDRDVLRAAVAELGA